MRRSLALLALLAACAAPPRPEPAPQSLPPIELDLPPPPSLEALQALAAAQNDARPPTGRSERLREAALAVGAQGGLAWETARIRELLLNTADRLDRAFDFRPLILRDRSGIALLPPVVAEGQDLWESQDRGRVLRLADAAYEILAPARFVPDAPLWQAYLLRSFPPPEPPPETLPRTEAERDLWRTAVAEGWDAGRRQAHAILERDLALLERDFQGMVRYRRLVAEGKATPPAVAEARHGVTGTDTAVRVGDRTLRIATDAALNRAPDVWRRGATERR